MTSTMDTTRVPKGRSGIGRAISRVFKTQGKETSRGRSMQAENTPEASRNSSPAIRIEEPKRPTSSSSVQTTYTTKGVMFGDDEDDSEDNAMPLTMPSQLKQSSRPTRFSLFGSRTSSPASRDKSPALDTCIVASRRTSSPFKRTRSRNPSPEKTITIPAPTFFSSNRTPSPHLQKRRQDSKFSSYSSLSTLSANLCAASTAPTSTNSSLLSWQRKPSHLKPITTPQLHNLSTLATAMGAHLNKHEDLSTHLCNNAKKLLEQKINLLSHHASYAKMNTEDKEIVIDLLRNIRLTLCNKFVRIANHSERSYATLSTIHDMLSSPHHSSTDHSSRTPEADDETSSDDGAEPVLLLEIKRLRDLRIALVTDLERQRAVVTEIIEVVEKGLTDVGRVLGRSRSERLIMLRFVAFLWQRLLLVQKCFEVLDGTLREFGEFLEVVER